jgi:Arm DNA-binding domain
MAMQALTVRGIEALKPQAKRYEIFDALTPSLAIRVGPSGRKSFSLVYRHHGRQRRLGLGRYPDVSLADVRKAATHHRGRIFSGADPVGEKEAERAQNDNTVQALYELYRSRQEKILRSWSEARRIMEREVLPVWRHRRVVDIRRRDIRELVEHKAVTSTIQANRVLQRLATAGPRPVPLKSGAVVGAPVMKRTAAMTSASCCLHGATSVSSSRRGQSIATTGHRVDPSTHWNESKPPRPLDFGRGDRVLHRRHETQ